MKKLFSFLLIFLFLTACDDPGTKYRKQNCEKFLAKNSDEYKDCTKSSSHYFVYSLEEDLKRIQKEIIQHNEKVKIVNSIGHLVNEQDYEEVDLATFLDENFEDRMILTLKNRKILNKKIKFKSGFYIGLSEEDENSINLTKKDPDDYYNSLWFFDGNFYNIDVKEKLIYPKNQRLYWMGTTGDTESEIFGFFRDTPGSYGSNTKFYIQDIKVSRKNYNRQDMIDYLVEQHAHSYGKIDDPDKPSVDEVRLKVKSLIKQIIK